MNDILLPLNAYESWVDGSFIDSMVGVYNNEVGMLFVIIVGVGIFGGLGAYTRSSTIPIVGLMLTAGAIASLLPALAAQVINLLAIATTLGALYLAYDRLGGR